MGLFSRFLGLFFALVLVGSVAFAASPFLDISDRNPSVSNHLINNVVNLHDAASDADSLDVDSALFFEILSESNPSLDCYIDTENGTRYIDCRVVDFGSSDSSVIQVQVKDSSGNTGTDYFTINFSDSGSSNSSSICSDIAIETNSLRINEDSFENFSITIRNLNESRGFEIGEVNIFEDSQHIRIGSEEFESGILKDGTVEVFFDVESFSVGSNREIIATIEVRGEFGNGTDCGFNSIRETFRVVVVDSDGGIDSGSGSSSSICSDIVIDDSGISLPEDGFETIEVPVRNDNSRAFYIDFVEQPVENSGYFGASVLHRPDKISAGSDGIIRLRFETEKVSSDQFGNISLRINGHFSDGTNCSTSQIREQVPVVVENGNSDSSSSTSTVNDIDVRFTQPTIELQPGGSKFVLATIENNSGSRKCMGLEFLSSSPISGELDDGSICINAQSGLSVNVKVKAGFAALPGSYTGRLRAQVGSKYASEILAVKVAGLVPQQPEGSLEVLNYPNSVSVLQNDSETVGFVVANSSNASLANVSVTLENLPQGVFFQPYFRPTLEKGEIATINSRLQAVNAAPGQFDALLRISAGGKTVVKPITIVVSPQGGTTAGTGAISGLASLAGTASVGLLLLAVLVAIVLIVVHLVRR